MRTLVPNQGKSRYDSITYGNMGGIHLRERHIRLPKIGEVKVKLHTPQEGIIKTVTIKREGEHWYQAKISKML